MENNRVRVAINGFGRIGRLVFRYLMEEAFEDSMLYHDVIELVAVNDLVPPKSLLYNLRYDSVHGPFPYICTLRENDGKTYFDTRGDFLKSIVVILNERDPASLPWKELGVDVVVEASGVFVKREALQKHIAAGAKKVILTAPADSADDVDVTLVLGANEEGYDPKKHNIISNASCTTNCLAPLAKILNEEFGILSGMAITTHAYTADQRLVDAPHKSATRGMAAAQNIVPSKTGAAKAIGLVLPELAGKLDGLAYRVPVSDGSIVSLIVNLKRKTTKEEVNSFLQKKASEDKMGILQFSEDPLVSSAIIGNTHSTVVDPDCTRVVDGNVLHVSAWYDNEGAYSLRVVDLIGYIADQDRRVKCG